MSLATAQVAARAASSKTTEPTVLLDVGELLGITDHFVVTSGRNSRQVKAIVDEVSRQLREADGTLERRIEGLASAEWVLIDYGDLVVHVFSESAREFYDLERLWADAPRCDYDDELARSADSLS